MVFTVGSFGACDVISFAIVDVKLRIRLNWLKVLDVPLSFSLQSRRIMN